MKIFYAVLIGFCLIGLTGSAYAGAWVDGQGNVHYPTEQTQTYQGAGGNAYQYDLNRPVDANRYGTDTGAQMRDAAHGNGPGAVIDSTHGQNGGGVWGN